MRPRALLRGAPAFLLALLLVGCGQFPRPFLGNPGAAGAHLALPPPPLLAVPRPTNAFLPAGADEPFASMVAKALAERTVPALAEAPREGDWRLEITASREGDAIVPRYTVIDPTLKRQGAIAGEPVPAALWTSAAPPALEKVASTDAPAIARLLTEIDARLKRSNPNSLMNRKARVYFAGVIDAPTDGDALLAGAMRRDLPALGIALQKEKRGADFTVLGKVAVSPAGADRTKVELQWIVTDARGRDRGRVVQLNEVATKEIEPSWADVVPEITEQAAGGLRDLIEKAKDAP